MQKNEVVKEIAFVQAKKEALKKGVSFFKEKNDKKSYKEHNAMLKKAKKEAKKKTMEHFREIARFSEEGFQKDVKSLIMDKDFQKQVIKDIIGKEMTFKEYKEYLNQKG